MSPMAEGVSSSVQIPVFLLPSCVALGKLLKFLHFHFLIHKSTKTKTAGMLREVTWAI